MCMVWCQCVYVTNNQALPSHLLCHYCSDGREEDCSLLMFVTRPTSAYTGLNRGAVYNRFFLVYNAFKYKPGWPPNFIPYSQCSHCRILPNAYPYESLAVSTPSKTFRPITLCSRHSSQNSMTTTSRNSCKLGSGVLVEDMRVYTMEN